MLGELGEGGEFVFDDCGDRGVDVMDAGIGFGDDLGGGEKRVVDRASDLAAEPNVGFLDAVDVGRDPVGDAVR